MNIDIEIRKATIYYWLCSLIHIIYCFHLYLILFDLTKYIYDKISNFHFPFFLICIFSILCENHFTFLFQVFLCETWSMPQCLLSFPTLFHKTSYNFWYNRLLFCLRICCPIIILSFVSWFVFVGANQCTKL